MDKLNTFNLESSLENAPISYERNMQKTNVFDKNVPTVPEHLNIDPFVYSNDSIQKTNTFEKPIHPTVPSLPNETEKLNDKIEKLTKMLLKQGKEIERLKNKESSKKKLKEFSNVEALKPKEEKPKCEKLTEIQQFKLLQFLELQRKNEEESMRKLSNERLRKVSNAKDLELKEEKPKYKKIDPDRELERLRIGEIECRILKTTKNS